MTNKNEIQKLQQRLDKAETPKERNKIFQRIKKLKLEKSCIVKN